MTITDFDCQGFPEDAVIAIAITLHHGDDPPVAAGNWAIEILRALDAVGYAVAPKPIFVEPGSYWRLPDGELVQVQSISFSDPHVVLFQRSNSIHGQTTAPWLIQNATREIVAS